MLLFISPLKIRIVIYNLNGLTKADKEIVTDNGVAADFNCADLDFAPGMYFTMITGGNEKVVRKIMAHRKVETLTGLSDTVRFSFSRTCQRLSDLTVSDKKFI